MAETDRQAADGDARQGARSAEARTQRDPDDERKPDSPTKLQKVPAGFGLKRAVREFSDDQCTDLAAALTYYSVLALFPALVAVVSLLGVFGQGPSTIDSLIKIMQNVAPGSATQQIRSVLQNISSSQGAGFGLVLGLLGALWSASGYVAAFSRAMNRIYEIGEGRPFYKLRPQMLLVTAVSLVLVAVVAVMLVVSGSLAQAVGSQIGLGSTAVTVWQIAKWPVLVAVVIFLIALLYWATPNVKQPKFRWMSLGAFVALVVWVVASVAFGFYVANFGSYNKTYGTLAGVIVFLLWLWLTNVALLFGAEVDSELERGRELQGGIAAEDELQLPPRDTKQLKKKAEKEAKDRQQAIDIRERHESGAAEQHS